MNYWLDIRLKIRSFFRKHKKKIVIILIIWAVIVAINYFLKNRPTIEVPKTTYEPHSPIMDTTDSVPESYKQPINNLINNYIEYCNNKEYENAYNLLSSAYKARYCDNIEDFKEYVNNEFKTKKIYNIQNYSNLNNTYIYKIHILDDILASGTTDEYTYIEDKYVIKEENGILKISLNGYCGSEDINVEADSEYLNIKILKKDIEYDKEIYTVEFKNKSQYFIVLADNTEESEISLQVAQEKREEKSIIGSNLILLPKETETREITFTKYFDDGQSASSLDFNAIRVLPAYSGKQENAEKEKEKAIKLYSLSINLN